MSQLRQLIYSDVSVHISEMCSFSNAYQISTEQVFAQLSKILKNHTSIVLLNKRSFYVIHM